MEKRQATLIRCGNKTSVFLPLPTLPGRAQGENHRRLIPNALLFFNSVRNSSTKSKFTLLG